MWFRMHICNLLKLTWSFNAQMIHLTKVGRKLDKRCLWNPLSYYFCSHLPCFFYLGYLCSFGVLTVPHHILYPSKTRLSWQHPMQKNPTILFIPSLTKLAYFIPNLSVTWWLNFVLINDKQTHNFAFDLYWLTISCLPRTSPS